MLTASFNLVNTVLKVKNRMFLRYQLFTFLIGHHVGIRPHMLPRKRSKFEVQFLMNMYRFTPWSSRKIINSRRLYLVKYLLNAFYMWGTMWTNFTQFFKKPLTALILPFCNEIRGTSCFLSNKNLVNSLPQLHVVEMPNIITRFSKKLTMQFCCRDIKKGKLCKYGLFTIGRGNKGSC